MSLALLRTRTFRALAAAGTALTLVACGGDGDAGDADDEMSPSEVMDEGMTESEMMDEPSEPMTEG